MRKIFPFYKGINIANNPLGYSSEKNARLRMNRYAFEKDFIKTLPDNYWLDYTYVCELEYPYEDGLKPENYNIHTSGAFYNITYYTRGYIKTHSETYIKHLPENVRDLFLRLYQLESISDLDEYYHKHKHKDEYKSLIFEILKKGWKPSLYKDEKDYKKRLSEFITDNIEFKEMEVEINVK